MDYPSVEQGCLRVISTRIFVQTPLDLALPSMMFVTVLVSHLFFRQRGLAEQVTTREHPAYLKSGLRLSCLVSTDRVDRLGVSASEDACAYHVIWLYTPCTSSSTVGSRRSTFVVYLGVLLC
jgi:hypothetical protein